MISGGRHRPLGLLLSLGIALLLWLVSELSQPAQTALDFRVQWLAGREVQLSERSGLPDVLRLHVRASGWKLLALHLRRTPLRLPVPAAESTWPAEDEESQRRWLAERLPTSLELVGVEGLEVLGQGQPFGQKKVPVRLRSRWTFDPEYGPAGPPQLQPDSVWLSGPADVLDTLQVCPTEWVVLRQLRQAASGRAALQLPSGATWRAEPADVAYYQGVDRLTERVIHIPIQPPLPGRSLLIPDQVEVRFTVPLSQYDAVLSNSFHAEVSTALSDSLAGRWVDVQLSRIPEGVSRVSWHPRRVEHLVLPQ